MRATKYYNAAGGQNLYSFSSFKAKGVELCFLSSDAIEYSQFGHDFIPNLSILDVMMFNSNDEVKRLLNAYSLITSDISKDVVEQC